MTRLTRAAVGVLAVALLVAPAAWACCDLGIMGAKCSMQESTHAMPAMAASHESVRPAPCHGDDRMSSDCCEVRSAPAPVLAPTHEPAWLLSALELAGHLAATPPTSAVPAVPAEPPRAWRLHDVGRYTLFSSLLL